MQGARRQDTKRIVTMAANTRSLRFRFEPDSGHILLRRSLAMGESPNHKVIPIIQKNCMKRHVVISALVQQYLDNLVDYGPAKLV